MKTNKYIAIKDSRIILCVHTSDGVNGIIKSLSGVGYDEIKEIPVEDCGFNTGMDIREFKDNKLRPLKDRVAEGLVIVPDGQVVDGECFRDMTLEEKVNSGIEILPGRTRVVGNEFIPMTDEEIIESCQATREQLDEEKVDAENEILIFNKMRELAISELKKEGKIK